MDTSGPIVENHVGSQLGLLPEQQGALSQCSRDVNRGEVEVHQVVDAFVDRKGQVNMGAPPSGSDREWT